MTPTTPAEICPKCKRERGSGLLNCLNEVDCHDFRRDPAARAEYWRLRAEKAEEIHRKLCERVFSATGGNDSLKEVAEKAVEAERERCRLLVHKASEFFAVEVEQRKIDPLGLFDQLQRDIAAGTRAGEGYIEQFVTKNIAESERGKIDTAVEAERERCKKIAHKHRAVDVYCEISGGESFPRLPPIQMLLWCPTCKERHVDEGEFAAKPHHTHACQACGMVWRPAVEDTVGARFLPGFKMPEQDL